MQARFLIFAFVLTLGSAKTAAQVRKADGAQHGDSVFSSDSARQATDTSCNCHPSIPLEITASALTVGTVEWWFSHALFAPSTENKEGFQLLVPALLLYTVTLDPIAEWTSGCEANAWNTVWMGAISHTVCIAGYALAYGLNHPISIDRFYWPEYVALGVLPAAITSLWYNIFLHCRPKANPPSGLEGMYLVPSVGMDKSLALNFGMRF